MEQALLEVVAKKKSRAFLKADRYGRAMTTLGDYVKNGKELFITRSQGGIGDILNTRMLFKDLKRVSNGMRITYLIPEIFVPLVIDHPYIDEVGASLSNDMVRYSFKRDITNKCGEYEQKTMPMVDKHRSDIWAEYIGYELTDHSMYLGFYKEELKWANKIMRKYRKKMKIAIQPITNHPSKNWELKKWQELINILKKNYKCEIFCFHRELTGLKNVVGFYNVDLREWMVLTYLCDKVITCATCMFPLANALHKPTVAIFGCEDLNIYGKYFPEMIPIQRNRVIDPGWNACPCWDGWFRCMKENKVGLKDPKDFPPPCLKDITVEEVMKGFEKCLRQNG